MSNELARAPIAARINKKNLDRSLSPSSYCVRWFHGADKKSDIHYQGPLRTLVPRYEES